VLVQLRLRQVAQAVDEVHRQMIGIRASASAALAALLCAVTLSGAGDFEARVAADRLVVERAERAAAALEALEAAIEPALEAARRGAARIVAGDASPGRAFAEAADATSNAESAAFAAATAVDELAAAQRARDPGSAAPSPPLRAGDLASIAGQLDATGAEGDAFAAVRRSADRVTPELERALAALQDGDLATAEEAVASARTHHAAVAAQELSLATLPVWLETTDAMIGAMETIVTATRAGDAGRAREAAAEFAALGNDAAEADRALRIAMAEGGASVSATALGRLADAVASLRDARSEVAAILQTARR
jgi:hypothetical protein